MVQDGVDAITGEIWLEESAAPIRPLMQLPEFMETFEPLGVARMDMAQNPFPQCAFGTTVRIGNQLFSVSSQFSDRQSTPTPELRMLRLFAVRAPWRRKQSGILLTIRRFFSSNPLMVGLPKSYESLQEQRLIYESWLSTTMGQSNHEQNYAWGSLKLVDSRNECWFIQFEFNDMSASGGNLQPGLPDDC